MSILRRWSLALCLCASVLTIAGCPSATAPIKPDQESNEPSVDAGQPDGGLPDAGEVDAGPTVDGGPEAAEPPDAGAAQADRVVPAGGNDKIETPEEKEGREAREKEEAEKKEQDENRSAEEAENAKLKPEIDARLIEASKLADSGDDEKALAAYGAMLKDFPKAYVAHYNMGVVYDRAGETEKAIGEYRAALDVKPDFPPANDNLDRLYIRAGKLGEAEENARRIPVHDNQVDAQNQLVRVLIAKGDLSGAEILAKRVLKVDERNVDAMLSLGEIWYEQKKFELAKQVLDNAREIDPKVPAVWNLMAFVYLALDLRPNALDAFRKAAALREDFPEAHNNLGAMLNEVNDCDGATRELEMAVRYAPQYAQAHLNLGNAYRCSRRYADAEREYQKNLALDPKSTDAIFNLAILYLDGSMEMKWDKTNPVDSDKLERLRKAKEYFDKYSSAGGADPRYDRYYAEAEKAIDKEQARLKHVNEMDIKSKAREVAKKEKEEADQKERDARLAKINALKVEGKSDFESDSAPSADEEAAPAPAIPSEAPPAPVVAPATPAPEPAPAAAPPPETPAVAAPPAVAPTSAAAPPSEPVRHMQKIAPKEDEPDSTP